MKRILLLFVLMFSISRGQEDLSIWLEKQIISNSSFEAEFIQKTYQAGSKTPEKFSGKLIASKPFTVKIDYDKPFEQTIFITKEKTILYTPSEKQAIITKKDTDLFIEDLVAVLLSTKPLKSVFDIQTDNKTNIILKPKNSSDIKQIEFKIKNETVQLITATDNEGNRFELEFKSFKFSPKKHNISFEVPKDAKVINY